MTVRRLFDTSTTVICVFLLLMGLWHIWLDAHTAPRLFTETERLLYETEHRRRKQGERPRAVLDAVAPLPYRDHVPETSLQAGDHTGESGDENLVQEPVARDT